MFRPDNGESGPVEVPDPGAPFPEDEAPFDPPTPAPDCPLPEGGGPSSTETTERSSEAKWHATGWPWPRSTRAGSSWAQISWAFQHRVLKRQPVGGLTGLGTSPSKTIRFLALSARGSGNGIADSKAWVYG